LLGYGFFSTGRRKRRRRKKEVEEEDGGGGQGGEEEGFPSTLSAAPFQQLSLLAGCEQRAIVIAPHVARFNALFRPSFGGR